MAAPTSNVTGTFKDPKGNALAGTISFIALDTPFTSGGDVVVSQTVNAILDVNGKVGISPVVTLVRGNYRVVVSDVDAFIIAVPGDAGTHDVSTISVDVGPTQTLKTIVSASDIGSLLQDTSTIEKSLKGDKYYIRNRIVVFGEQPVLNSTTFLYNQWLAMAASDVICLGNANTGGLSTTIDANIGKTFHSFILGYSGSWGPGASITNHFWYALGSEDWIPGNVTAVTNFFTFPTNGNAERYYKTSMASGAIDLFVLDSNASEPDGNTQGSTQGLWLQAQLAASTAAFKIVAFRDTPTCSKTSYSFPNMNWPFVTWGASLVLCGGAKFYERIDLGGGVPLIVCGTAFDTTTGMDNFGTPVTGSQVRVRAPGFLTIDANFHSLNLTFIDSLGIAQDSIILNAPDTTNVYLTTKINEDNGLLVNGLGLGLSFGTAQNQVLSGPSVYTSIQGGRVIRVDTLPAATVVRDWPYRRDCIWMVGDDPCGLYYYNEANQSIDLIITAPHVSYWAGARTRLAQPTFSYSDGSQTAFTQINHVDSTVQIWYSVNGSTFVQMTNWSTNPRVFNTSTSPWWIAAYARKSGSIDSLVAYASYTALFKQA